MHATWKVWLHWGSTRISLPAANSERQIGHSEEDNLAADSAVKVSFGSDLRIFFFKPLLARAAAWGGGIEGGEVEVVVLLREFERRRSHAQRATATRPSTQMSAQRSAARITTKSESTATGWRDSAVVVIMWADDEFTSPRDLNVRVMWRSERDRERKRKRECVCESVYTFFVSALKDFIVRNEEYSGIWFTFFSGFFFVQFVGGTLSLRFSQDFFWLTWIHLWFFTVLLLQSSPKRNLQLLYPQVNFFSSNFYKFYCVRW